MTCPELTITWQPHEMKKHEKTHWTFYWSSLANKLLVDLSWAVAGFFPGVRSHWKWCIMVYQMSINVYQCQLQYLYSFSCHSSPHFVTWFTNLFKVRLLLKVFSTGTQSCGNCCNATESGSHMPLLLQYWIESKVFRNFEIIWDSCSIDWMHYNAWVIKE